MHPGIFFSWLRRHHHHHEEAHAGEGGHHGHHGHHRHGPFGDHERWAGGPDEDLGGGAFGVRRPLRFLAWKLDLDEPQIAELAKVLEELKTERAQAAVDGRRTTAAFADAIAGEQFETARAGEGAKLRLQSAERLRDAVLKALQKLHAVLRPEQRQKLSTLIRTGALSI